MVFLTRQRQVVWHCSLMAARPLVKTSFRFPTLGRLKHKSLPKCITDGSTARRTAQTCSTAASPKLESGSSKPADSGGAHTYSLANQESGFTTTFYQRLDVPDSVQPLSDSFDIKLINLQQPPTSLQQNPAAPEISVDGFVRKRTRNFRFRQPKDLARRPPESNATSFRSR